MTTLQINTDRSGGFFFYSLMKSIHYHASGDERSVIKGHWFKDASSEWDNTPYDFFSVDHLTISEEGFFLDVDVLLREFVRDVNNYVLGCSHIMSDCSICARHGEVAGLFDRIFYLVRDPRSVVASWAQFYASPYCRTYRADRYFDQDDFLQRRALSLAESWRNHARSVLDFELRSDVYIIRYEDLSGDLAGTARQIIDDLGLDISDDLLSAICHDLSFAQMKKRNPMHLQSGMAGDWGEVIGRYADLINEVAGVEMAEFGYV